MSRSAPPCRATPTWFRSPGRIGPPIPSSFAARVPRLLGRGRGRHAGFLRSLCLAMIPEFKAAVVEWPIFIWLSYDEDTTCLLTRLPPPPDLQFDLPKARRGHRWRADLDVIRLYADKSVSTHVTWVRGFEINSANLHKGVSAMPPARPLVAELDRIGYVFRAEGDPSGIPSFSSYRSCRRDRRRHGAQHRRARLRVPVAVSRPAGGRFVRRARSGVCLHASAAGARVQGPSRNGVEMVTETDVPGLCRSRVRRRSGWRCGWPRPIEPSPFPMPPGPGNSSAPASRLCCAARAASTEAHQPDEFVEIGELAACIQFMRGLARELSA